jgi:hydrogenase maturation factor
VSGPVCITCGDVAVPMRVMKIDVEAALALCATETGETSEVEVGLVDPVGKGDTVLVHACVALQRLG